MCERMIGHAQLLQSGKQSYPLQRMNLCVRICLYVNGQDCPAFLRSQYTVAARPVQISGI